MYCDFEEYVKNRKPDKLSLKNLVDPSLEKPYDKDELALLSHLAVIYSESIHSWTHMRVPTRNSGPIHRHCFHLFIHSPDAPEARYCRGNGVPLQAHPIDLLHSYTDRSTHHCIRSVSDTASLLSADCRLLPH